MTIHKAVLTTRPAHPYRSLHGHEVIKKGDIVECLFTGRYQVVGESHFNYLENQKASEARERPGVFDVVRPY